MIYLYLLKDTEDNVVYAGQTVNTTRRFREHTQSRPLHSGRGLFYGRTDLRLEVVTIVDTVKEARKIEDQLKEKYNLFNGERWTGPILSRRAITQEDADKIRELKGVYPQTKLAKMFNCSRSTIRKVHNNTAYKKYDV